MLCPPALARNVSVFMNGVLSVDSLNRPARLARRQRLVYAGADQCITNTRGLPEKLSVKRKFEAAFGKMTNQENRSSSPPIRVLIAKPGLDGHDRGAKVIARALRDAGMEVIYTGLRQTPEQIVSAALEEDVEFIGLSILSGAHTVIVPRLMELLREKGMHDVKVVLGGTIVDEDLPAMKEIGVAAVFQPGTSLESIVHFMRENRPERKSL